MFLNVSTSRARSSPVRSTSCCTLRSCLRSPSACSNRWPLMPSTTSPYIWMRRRYESPANRAFPVARVSPATASSLRPRLRIVSIIPGIEMAAPERTDTSSGSSVSPKRFPLFSSRRAMCSPISSSRPSGASCRRTKARQASVVIVNPPGTGTPSWVISARPIPFPPRRSRPPSAGSSKSYTYLVMSADVVIPLTMVSPTIVGIGGFPDRAMAEYVLGLARGRRLLYVGTASMEDPSLAAAVDERLDGLAEVSHLELRQWPPDDLRGFALGHDV